MYKLYFLLLFSFITQSIQAQYQIGIIPRVSPDKMIYQKVGYTEVEIRYGSPSVNDRRIWGELVPYKAVWRAGANAATTVEFSSTVTIHGTTLDSGRYSLFVIPRKNDQWTIILNSVAKQWGAFRYDQAQDVLRVGVNPRIKSEKTQHLSYSIEQTGFKYGTIFLNWEYLELEIPFLTNYLDQFEKEIESRASLQPEYIQWVPYIQGAEHLVEIQNDIELASQWITQAERIMDNTAEWSDQFYPRDYVRGHLLWTKSKVLAWQERYTAALETVNTLKGIQAASYYKKQNDKQKIDASVDLWQARIDDK